MDSANPSANSTIPPHGGVLIDRVLAGDALADARTRAARLPRIPLAPVNLADLELIATGIASPLAGFMCRADYTAVVHDMHLASGLPWTVPITLAVTPEQAAQVREGQEVALAEGERVLAAMTVAEKFDYDKRVEAREVYRTTEEAHPGVARV